MGLTLAYVLVAGTNIRISDAVTQSWTTPAASCTLGCMASGSHMGMVLSYMVLSTVPEYFFSPSAE